jgi:hypothetical protein
MVTGCVATCPAKLVTPSSVDGHGTCLDSQVIR